MYRSLAVFLVLSLSIPAVSQAHNIVLESGLWTADRSGMVSFDLFGDEFSASGTGPGIGLDGIAFPGTTFQGKQFVAGPLHEGGTLVSHGETFVGTSQFLYVLLLDVEAALPSLFEPDELVVQGPALLDGIFLKCRGNFDCTPPAAVEGTGVATLIFAGAASSADEPFDHYHLTGLTANFGAAGASEVQPIPEPSTLLLLISGFIGLALWRIQHRQLA